MPSPVLSFTNRTFYSGLRNRSPAGGGKGRPAPFLIAATAALPFPGTMDVAENPKDRKIRTALRNTSICGHFLAGRLTLPLPARLLNPLYSEK